jgi:hypothetical protein
MNDNIMDQRLQSVLKFVRNEVSLHINGANSKCEVTLPYRPTGRSLSPAQAATGSARAVADLSHLSLSPRPSVYVCHVPRFV